jgi:hypothetical protein
VGLVAVPCSRKDRITVEEVRATIDRELTVGAAPQEIGLFLTKHDFEFGYDRFKKSYQAIIRNVSRKPLVDKAIQVYINTDDEKRFITATVYASYTFL